MSAPVILSKAVPTLNMQQLIDIQPKEWIVPDMWPAPFFVQMGERRCLAYGLGSQCQRPLGHGGDHFHQGVKNAAGEGYFFSAWSNLDISVDISVTTR